MYFVYLDESGDSRFRDDAREESDFFILGGLIVLEKNIGNINQKFREFKQQNLPENLWDYPIHAVELNHISKNKNSKYKGIFSDEQGRELLEKTYNLINTFPIEAIPIIIDTFELKRKYTTPINPYHIAYEILGEKIQKIVKKRKDENNCFALINLAECSSNLTIQLSKIHEECKKNGSTYAKWDNILNILNVEPNNKSCFYEIADIICYAFRRHYYGWLCKHLGKLEIKEDYLSQIKNICTLNIGSTLFGKEDDIHVKVFPEPRFLDKNEEKKDETK